MLIYNIHEWFPSIISFMLTFGMIMILNQKGRQLMMANGKGKQQIVNKEFEIQQSPAEPNKNLNFTDLQTELEKSHELLTKLSRQVPGVIYQYRLFEDGSSWFPYSSQGMNDIYEVTPEQVREDASPVFARIHPEDRERITELIFDSARTQQHFYAEFRVVLPRQGLRWRFCDAVPEKLADNSTLWHGIIYDITERKLAEEELHKKMHELQLFHDLTMDREIVMIGLKKEVNELLKRLGEPEKYRIVG